MGMMAGLGALFGGGGFGSIFGSILSLAGSVFGMMNQPEYPSPPPVQIPQATPTPELVQPQTPASLLSDSDKQQLSLVEKRKAALLKSQSSTTNNVTKGSVEEPFLDKPVLLGGR